MTPAGQFYRRRGGWWVREEKKEKKKGNLDIKSAANLKCMQKIYFFN